MKLWTLGSGSSGNALLLSCFDQHIMIDAGFGTRTLSGRMKPTGISPKQISACFLTHEHSDHTRAAERVQARWDWPLYATRGTAQNVRALEGARVSRIRAGMSVELDEMSVAVIATPHDAAESVGFVVTERRTGARAGVFYDIGHVTEAIRNACRDVDLLVIESNHDDVMLRNGPYPRWLQARIASDTGHLSNRCAADLLADCACRDLSHVVLAHLSEQNNTPSMALATSRGGLRKTRFKGTLTAARQDASMGPFVPRGSRADAGAQLTLF